MSVMMFRQASQVAHSHDVGGHAVTHPGACVHASSSSSIASQQQQQVLIQPCSITAAAAAGGVGRLVACSAASLTGIASPNDDGFLQPYGQATQQQQRQQQQQQQSAQSRVKEKFRALQHRTLKAGSYRQLLGLLQSCSREDLTADLLQVVLFRASRLAQSTAAAETASSAAAAASSSKSNSRSSSSRSSSGEQTAAQQLVCACLQLLLEVNEQINGWHLSNCLLSLGVLCSKDGPAATVLAGSTAAATSDPAGVNSFLHPQHQQQHQQQAAGVLEQLVNPVRSSRRDLEALLQATGPQHQLQQLLHLKRHTAVAAAQPLQLADMLYGLAVLRVRPAPDVLAIALQGLQQHLQQMGHGLTSSLSSSSSNNSRRSSAATAKSPSSAAAGERASGVLGPKQLSQLLWSAATLQLQLPQPWLGCYWAASLGPLQLYGPQDVSNTLWGLASLKQQQQHHDLANTADDSSRLTAWHLPPAWQAALLHQVSAVARGFTPQGLANTLWGFAVLELPVEPKVLLLLLQEQQRQQQQQQQQQQGRGMGPQELANIAWGAARCLHQSQQQQQQQQQLQQEATVQPAAVAAAGVLQECRMELIQVLHQLQRADSALSSQLLPRDWSSMLWAAGLVGVQPGKALLQTLWRKTPAAFSTSLNPHYALQLGFSSHKTPSSLADGPARVQGSLLNPTSWSPQALANTLWGLARLRVTPPRVWLQGFEAAAVAALPGFSAQHLANTLWALAELRQRPSEAFLQLFWQHPRVDELPQLLGAAAADSLAMLRQQRQQQQQQRQQQSGLLVHQQHVVQVLQACGRLGVEPPADWLHAAADSILAAAQVLLVQQQQQQVGAWDAGGYKAHLHSCAAAVHAFAQLSHAAAIKQQQEMRLQQLQRQQHSSGSGSTTGAVAAQAGQQLLLQMTQSYAAVGGQQLLDLLPASDLLALLLSVPKLHLCTRDACTAGAVLLLALQKRQQQRLTTSQMVQLAVATARVAACSNPNGCLWAAMQRQSSSSSTSTPAAVARAYLRQLSVQLTQHSRAMSGVELRISVAAVAKLQASWTALLQNPAAATAGSSSSSSSRSTSERVAHAIRRPSRDTVVFAAAAGAALGSKMSDLTPHQRSVVAASLAGLGYRPKPNWLELLLQNSSCDLSECSNGDLVRLLKGVGVMVGRMQQQQQQQQRKAGSLGVAGAAAAAGIHPQVLQEWAADWLQECGSRWGSLTAAQLVGVAQALARFASATATRPAAGRSAGGAGGGGARAGLVQSFRLVQQQHQGPDYLHQQRQQRQYHHHQQQQQQAVLQLPSSWHDGFLSATAQRLPELGPPELLILLSAVRQIQLAPSQEWCAAAAAAAGCLVQLRPHHVGWLAYHLSQLGYVPPADVQAVLLQYVAASCEGIKSQHTATATTPAGPTQPQPVSSPSSAAAAAAAAGGPGVLRRVPPRQLWQLLVLLQAAGWGLGVDWLQCVQGSAAGARLRRWFEARPQLGTWQQLWATLACSPALDGESRV